MEPWAEVDVLKAQWIVADEPQPADDDEIRRFTGEDYPELCGRCRAAIDAGWLMLIECELWDGRFYCDDDPEAGLMYAGDEKWLCGGHECACRQEEEVEEDEPEWTSWLAVDVTDYASGWQVVERVAYTIFNDSDDYHGLWDLARDTARWLDPKAKTHREVITAVIDHGATWTEINFGFRFGTIEQAAALLEGEDHV